jgi:hypothetical protein
MPCPASFDKKGTSAIKIENKKRNFVTGPKIGQKLGGQKNGDPMNFHSRNVSNWLIYRKVKRKKIRAN